MLAGFLLGIVHDRRLMREAAVNIAIRWFVGYGLHEPLPDHSSLTRIRQRWGAERFRRIFERTVRACIAARIATGEVVHLDASLIRAHVSWDALVVRHVEAVAEANSDDDALSESRQSGKFKKVCVTDPDATMATNGRNRRLEPAYKQHTAVDDIAGVIVDVEVATGEENEGMAVAERLDAVAMAAGRAMTIATMDAGYAYAKVFRALEDRQIEGIVPAKAEPPPGKVIPTRRFKFDALHNLARCQTMSAGDSADRISTRRNLRDDPRLLFMKPRASAARSREHLNPPRRPGDSIVICDHSKPNGSNQPAGSQITTSFGR
jgi:IS5 family transposase